MNRTAASLLSLALLLVLACGAGTASAATPGFAVYQITSSAMGVSHSLTINETVTAGSTSATDDLVLHVVSGNLTVTYSRLINSSDEVSPFLPSITNQSINYSYGANNVSLGLVRSGDVQVMFHGSEHALTRYIVSAVVAVNGSSYYGGGTISAFQSGLIYAVVLNTTIPASVLSAGVTGTALPSAFGGFAGLTQAIPIGLSVTLLSTSLPLSAPSASTSNQAVSAGIGIGVAASAVGLGLGVRRRNKHEETSEGAKPEHWVD